MKHQYYIAIIGSCLFFCFFILGHLSFAEENRTIDVELRSLGEGMSKGKEQWNPNETAIIICDMWDRHWCKGATARVAEMAPRMNKVLENARAQGVSIVHSPSDCMEFYENHPAHKRAKQYNDPEIRTFLNGEEWNNQLPIEKDKKWPIDQKDGGCDCDPKCPGDHPWKSQIATLSIDEEKDLVSDSGVAIASYFKEKGIKNVILMGVHTNMCVIGRPFGLRNMVKLGKNTVLMRDLTDTMYNSRSWPHVSHFKGTDLIIEYIENNVCPTITSTTFTGETPFVFSAAREKKKERPVVTVLISDDHYDADKLLPPMMEKLGKENGWEIVVLHGHGTANFPSFDVLKRTDVLVVYVRRFALPKEQMEKLKEYLASGGGLVGLRTACHAFEARDKIPEGSENWSTFDKDVLGCYYHDHGKNELGSDVKNVPELADSPILKGVEPANWHSTGSLYFVDPVDKNATVYQYVSSSERTDMPLTWTRMHGKSRIAFSALGHQDDFKTKAFEVLVRNLVDWTVAEVSVE